jgi:hypothetical protein
MTLSTPTNPHEVVTRTASRLALRQQNLTVLVPVLLHDVNGSLNGLALSTELLSRLQQREPADAASAASLLLRTKNELGRLKVALKTLENRVGPGGLSGQAPAREAPLLATLEEVQAVLLPAIRRGQHELHPAVHSAEIAIASRPEDLFDLLAALCIIAIEGAPPRAALDIAVESSGGEALVTVEHPGQARAGIALEMHRELLRTATAHAGGSVEWHQSGAGSRARMRLPRAQ